MNTAPSATLAGNTPADIGDIIVIGSGPAG